MLKIYTFCPILDKVQIYKKERKKRNRENRGLVKKPLLWLKKSKFIDTAQYSD